MISQNEFFYCYSPMLFNYLRFKKGIPFICTGKHLETHKQFWQFRRNEDLERAVKEYQGKNN